MRHIIKETCPLLEALADIFPDSSNNTLRTMLKDERVLVDGKLKANPKDLVQAGQKIEVLSHVLKKAKDEKGKKKRSLTIIYEDKDLVVVDKPNGLLSVATNFDTQNTAHAFVKKQHPRRKVYVIHRLDQETSGVMMFALTEEAYHKLKSDLAAHDVERIYYGVVEGSLSGKGSWVHYLIEDKNYLVHAYEKPVADSERAVTHYEAVKQQGNFTLVRFQLETGKKNQIRVQCAKAGHPIYGDEKYGAKLPFAKRLYLHAAELCFTHPITQKKLIFKSNLPNDFNTV